MPVWENFSKTEPNCCILRSFEVTFCHLAKKWDLPPPPPPELTLLLDQKPKTVYASSNGFSVFCTIGKRSDVKPYSSKNQMCIVYMPTYTAQSDEAVVNKRVD